jgi:pimeloyl-[acyl-carrier protein] methyl ester esterase
LRSVDPGAASGIPLHVVERGAGRPLVLVHGWSFSHRAFQPQLEDLARGARVLCPDLRGHGGSPGPEGGYAVDDFASDLVRLFEERALEGAVLAGWSWGAEVALAALQRLRPRLTGAALLSATPRFTAAPDWPHGLPAANVRALSRRLARDPGGTRRLFVEGLFADGELTPARREALAAALLEPAPALHAARATLDALAATDLRAAVAALAGLPVLVVHGDRDAVCPPGAGRWLAAAIPGARLELLGGAGHAPHLTRAAEVNALLRAFLEGLA